MKLCKLCKEVKPLSEFVKDKNSPGGRTTRCLLCERERTKTFRQTSRGSEYYREYLKEYYSKPANKTAKRQYDKTRYGILRERYLANTKRIMAINAAFIDAYKDKECQDCGRKFPPLCMDLDHVRGTKQQKLSLLKTARREIIVAELAKCDVVCANCHVLRTEMRRARSNNFRIIAFRTKIGIYKSKPCLDCGELHPPVVMQFDHVRGKKVGCISNMHGGPWARVLVELSKCEVVCAICHRVRTAARCGERVRKAA